MGMEASHTLTLLDRRLFYIHAYQNYNSVDSILIWKVHSADFRKRLL